MGRSQKAFRIRKCKVIGIKQWKPNRKNCIYIVEATRLRYESKTIMYKITGVYLKSSDPNALTKEEFENYLYVKYLEWSKLLDTED